MHSTCRKQDAWRRKAQRQEGQGREGTSQESKEIRVVARIPGAERRRRIGKRQEFNIQESDKDKMIQLLEK